MSRELRTATFLGHTYRFWAYEADDVRAVEGWAESIVGSPHPGDVLAKDTAAATWATFDDETEVRERWWKLSPGDVVIDAGPAFGSYTLTAAAQGAEVHAYEPCRFCREVLLRNNHVSSVAPRRGTVCFHSTGLAAETGWWDAEKAVFDVMQAGALGRLPVAALDSPSWVHAYDRLDVLKLDVEGAELLALRGARRTIQEFCPRILIEEHEFKSPGIGDRCWAFLDSLGLGYQRESVPHGGVVHSHYVAPR
jgi:FkbM family methyltransferase